MTSAKLILVESDPLVALDLSQILSSCLPGHDLEHYATLEGLPEAELPAAMLVFKAGSDKTHALDSIEKARNKAARVIAISDAFTDKDQVDTSVRIVMLPFSQTTIELAIASFKID